MESHEYIRGYDDMCFAHNLELFGRSDILSQIGLHHAAIRANYTFCFLYNGHGFVVSNMTSKSSIVVVLG